MHQQRPSNNKRHWRLALIGGVVAIGAIAGVLSRHAPASEPAAKPETPGVQSSAPVAATPAPANEQSVQGVATTPFTGQSGQRIFIDPQTGLPREGTPEEYQELAGSRLSGLRTAPAVEPTQFILPNGVVGVNVPESFDTSMVATRNPDGTISFSETTGNKNSLPEATKGISTTKKEVPSDR